jgi:23S rRNA (uracil1939-C5)-methyltransferase
MELDNIIVIFYYRILFSAFSAVNNKMSRSLVVEIEKMIYGGRGLGRINGQIIFVPFTAPGDRVRVEVVREKKDYKEAVLAAVERQSPFRVKPFCALFGRCGGCHYQHLSYPLQLQLKEEGLQDSLFCLRGRESLEVLPAIPSPQDRGYRIRAQLKGGRSGSRGILGFYGLKSHSLVEVKECPLLHPLANDILRGLQNWADKEQGIGVRKVDIQVSPVEGKGVIQLQADGHYSPRVAEILGKEIPGVKGVALEGKRKTSWGDLTLLYCWEKISGEKSLPIRADFDSFSQVNPYQNWNLIQRVVEWAALSGRERVLDLFCGSGNLTLPLAQRAGKVWGVDLDSRAIQMAAENARENGLANCTFLAAGAEAGIREISRETESIEVAVLDPPRAGAKEALDVLGLLRPEKILYVSCEPPTLARDLAHLEALGYQVKRVQPLDMFPHTYHIEAIAELSAVSTQQRQKMKNDAVR